MRAFSKDYLNLLKGEFSGINLTRILDEEEFYQKQILDALVPFEKSEELKKVLCESSLIIDIGFGGGFPILPLAKNFPEKQFLGFEARAKKADVVTKIANHLRIKNAKLFHLRVEDVLIDCKNVLFTFKAVSEIGNLLPLLNCDESTHALFFKGPSLENERPYQNLGLAEILKFEYELPSKDYRQVILLKKIVPRGTISIKNLVKVSALL